MNDPLKRRVHLLKSSAELITMCVVITMGAVPRTQKLRRYIERYCDICYISCYSSTRTRIRMKFGGRCIFMRRIRTLWLKKDRHEPCRVGHHGNARTVRGRVLHTHIFKTHHLFSHKMVRARVFKTTPRHRARGLGNAAKIRRQEDADPTGTPRYKRLLDKRITEAQLF